MKRLLPALILISLALMPAPARALDKPLDVVASFSILGDMVKTIGGPDVNVTTIVGPDTDTHVYEPTPLDAKALARAQLVFINGLGFEGWMGKLAQSTGYKGTIVTVTNGIKTRTMDDEGKVVTDPHAWQSAANARIYAKNITTALIKALPAKAAAISVRANIYDKELADLDAWVHNRFKDVPPAARNIITSHDAFGYFGLAYGLTFMAPEGVNTDAEPTAADVAKLTDQIKAAHARTVFLENMANARLIKQIAKDTGATIGGTLYADALSPLNGPASTYIDLMRNNAGLMAAGLDHK